MDERDVIRLLVEIRDLQREHLEEYRRAAQESLELQRRAVRRQEQINRLYRWVVAVSALVVAAAVISVIWLLGGFR
jgi:hypothetical protein